MVQWEERWVRQVGHPIVGLSMSIVEELENTLMIQANMVKLSFLVEGVIMKLMQSLGWVYHEGQVKKSN